MLLAIRAPAPKPSPYLSHTACLLQLELSRRLPLCYASLIGTHNSGITLADGYGNLDLAYQHYFRWISWVVSAKFLPAAAFHLVPVICMQRQGSSVFIHCCLAGFRCLPTDQQSVPKPD